MTENLTNTDSIPFEPITHTEKASTEDANKKQEAEKKKKKTLISIPLTSKGDNEIHLTLGWIFVIANAYLTKKEDEDFMDVAWKCCHASQLTRAAHDFIMAAIDRKTPFIRMYHEAAPGVEDIYGCEYDKKSNLITVHFLNGENLYDERSLSIKAEPIEIEEDEEEKGE